MYHLYVEPFIAITLVVAIAPTNLQIVGFEGWEINELGEIVKFNFSVIQFVVVPVYNPEAV